MAISFVIQVFFCHTEMRQKRWCAQVAYFWLSCVVLDIPPPPPALFFSSILSIVIVCDAKGWPKEWGGCNSPRHLEQSSERPCCEEHLRQCKLCQDITSGHRCVCLWWARAGGGRMPSGSWRSTLRCPPKILRSEINLRGSLSINSIAPSGRSQMVKTRDALSISPTQLASLTMPWRVWWPTFPTLKVGLPPPPPSPLPPQLLASFCCRRLTSQRLPAMRSVLYVLHLHQKGKKLCRFVSYYLW